MMIKREKVSFIITSMNEFHTIDEFIGRIDQAFKEVSYDYEIIFVDDRSTDGSLTKLIKYSEEDSRIKVISMARNFGRHECFFVGFKEATGDYGVTMDSDLQDPPELIPQMLEKLKKENADLVYSVMTKRFGESKTKLLLTRVSYWLLNKFCFIKMPENAGYLKVFNKRFIDEINKIEEPDSYFKGLYNYIGLKQVPFRYERDPRSAGKTQFSLFGHRPYKDFLKAITSFSYTLLYLPVIIAVALLMLAVTGMGVYFLSNGFGIFFEKLATSPIAIYFTFLTAIIIGSIGIVALYIIQVHSATRKRPRYIVDKIYSKDHTDE